MGEGLSVKTTTRIGGVPSFFVTWLDLCLGKIPLDENYIAFTTSHKYPTSSSNKVREFQFNAVIYRPRSSSMAP